MTHRTVAPRASLLALGAVALLAASAVAQSPGTSPASASAPPPPAPPASVPPASSPVAGSPSPSAAADQGVLDPATVPATFPFRSIADHIVVDATIAGGEPLRFMLDTGAPVDLATAIVDDRQLPVVSQITSQAGGSVSVTNDIVLVPGLTVGPVAIGQTGALSGWVDRSNPLSCISPNGLIGANAMQGGVWQIDYQARTVTVAATTDGLDHIGDAIALDFITSPGSLAPSPFVGLKVGTAVLPFAVDTGSDGTISIGPDQLASGGVAIPADAPTVVARASGAGGSFDIRAPFVTTEVGLNETTSLTATITAAALTGAVGNIGNGFLENFVVTFDWPASTIYLDPVFDGTTVPAPSVSGAGVGWDGQRFTVTSLALGGPADRRGLELGDEVVRVNGRAVTDRADACRILRNPATTLRTTDGTRYAVGPIEGFLTGD